MSVEHSLIRFAGSITASASADESTLNVSKRSLTLGIQQADDAEGVVIQLAFYQQSCEMDIRVHVEPSGRKFRGLLVCNQGLLLGASDRGRNIKDHCRALE